MATKREVELARYLRRRATSAERVAWELLRDRRLGGFKFKRQHPIDDFIVDFYCPALGLALEVDGGVHNDPEQAAYDDLRTAALEAIGVTIRRVRNEDVSLLTFQQLIASVLRSPSPRDSVERGPGGEA